jgi:nucleotide-binding universal stress UspA family protein
MTYATLMVHLELGRTNSGLLKIAGDLAEQFHAAVIGIATCQPLQLIYTAGYTPGYIPSSLIEQDREEAERKIAAAEKEFRDALSSRISRLEWRSTARFGSLAQEARSADLIITCVDQPAEIGDLVMQVGRPVLVVPVTADKFNLNNIIVGWKDTGESRRAVSDALPFLEAAAKVTVVDIAAEDDLPNARKHLSDVVAWLERHGIVAEALALASDGDDAAGLDTVARDLRADLIVAGAYGHSRVREWVLGGVTRDLLLRADRCSLISH